MRILLTCVFLFTAGLLLAQAASDLNGDWIFTFETEGGVRNAPASFQVDGTKVTGKFDKSDVKGTYEDGKLNLEFPLNSDEAGFTAIVKITGKMDDGKLTGSWSFGGEHTGTYVAKRKAS